MQNKVESPRVLFLLFQAHFCWDESNENFQRRKSYVFPFDFSMFPTTPPPMLEIHEDIDTDMENIELCNIEIRDALICF